jgi:ABC-type transporter Mla MlaB component
MLRILVFEEPFSVKLRLEGSLTSQTVPVLLEQWTGVRGGLKGRKAILDLGDVPFVDDAGRSTLYELATSGARLGYAHPKVRPLVEAVSREAGGATGVRAAIKRLHDVTQRWAAACRESAWYLRLCEILPASVRPCGCRTA